MTKKQLPATPRFKISTQVVVIGIDDSVLLGARIGEISEIILTNEGIFYVIKENPSSRFHESTVFTREEALKKFNQWMEENV